MKKNFTKSSFITSVFLGFVFLTPFIALEVINRWKFNEGFPFAVFIFTWVLQTAFIYLLLPIVKSIRVGKFVTKNPIRLLLRIAGLIFIVYIWGGWIADQWPCLMGIPNCD